jgi:GLPGLI family protein
MQDLKKNDADKKNDVDKSFDATIKCYYTFSQTNEKKEVHTDTMALLIGDTKSKFFNPARQIRDSIFSSIIGNINPSTIQSISVMKGDDLAERPGNVSVADFNDGESYQIFKYRTTGTLTFIDYTDMMSGSYEYKDKFESSSWQMVQDTASLLGYPCQKATIDFRGREFIAWFSTDIPVNDGPWKFMGLPGLILKIHDTGNIFCFELIGIEHINPPIPVQIPKARYDCNRSELEKLKKKQSKSMQINVNGGNIVISSSKETLHYNPIELDH